MGPEIGDRKSLIYLVMPVPEGKNLASRILSVVDLALTPSVVDIFDHHKWWHCMVIGSETEAQNIYYRQVNSRSTTDSILESKF